ncbi:hypothetical protein MMC11_006008 [Xylographa trunciseda]|nr:hypothetical protein [Xylographa trunciseda]
MAALRTPLPVNPGKGLGFMVLGASLHDILTRLKAQPYLYPKIDVTYSSSDPLGAPVAVALTHNGIRLRFDGPDQRLRLIEVLNFARLLLTYKDVDLVKQQDEHEAESINAGSTKPNGPAFRQIYHKLFGPTFPGEYLRPKEQSTYTTGTYVLSYPGVAFSFPLRDSAWSEKADFVELLSTSAAFPAKCLTIFDGSSWKEAREDLYTRPCPHPRSLALGGRGKEGSPDEIEFVKICGRGHIELLRRSSPSFHLMLSETTTQDLVAELGPPDAIYRKNDRRLSIHKARTRSGEQAPYASLPVQLDGQSDTDRNSVINTTDESDFDEAPLAVSSSGISTECFYNYFHHGFDIFVSCPSSPSPGLVPSDNDEDKSPISTSTDRLVATKLLLHANIPGSYPFNRYRRSRWFLDPKQIWVGDSTLNSESRFAVISTALQDAWRDTYVNEEQARSLQRAMVLNRGWGDSPGSSCELLGGWEESGDASKRDTEGRVSDGATALGNTELFGFPGLLFEVLKNDAVSCLTVY